MIQYLPLGSKKLDKLKRKLKEPYTVSRKLQESDHRTVLMMSMARLSVEPWELQSSCHVNITNRHCTRSE